jgi:nitroreductase
MDVLETMRTRASVRAFSDESVPRELLEQVVKDAGRAPSAINMQPWELHAVLGEERRRLSRALMKSYRERGLTCGPGTSKPLPEIFIQRGRECADGMTPLMEKTGTDFKTYINEGSLDFYGAPVAMLMFLDEVFPADRMTDIGVFTAYLLLSAEGHGLATCPIGLINSYEEDVKYHLNIPDSKKLVVSVALGKPAPDSPVNEFRSPRADTAEFVRWID